MITSGTDKMLTVSNHQGDTPFDSYIVKGEISNVLWSPAQSEELKTICCIVSQKKVFKYDPRTQQHCFIEFDSSYGKILKFLWLDSTKLFCTFATGQCAIVSMEQ